MSSGQRLKFQDSNISAVTSYTGSQTITDATNANPCVLEIVAHTYAVGDVIKPASIVGMTELNGNSYVISAKTTDTVTLRGVDSTDYAAYTSGGTASKGVFSNFCELTGFNRSGGGASEISASTICSDAAEFEVGLRAFGNVKLDYNLAPTVVQTAFETAEEDGSQMFLKRVLPKNAGATVYTVLVLGTDDEGQVDDLWKGSANLKITGSPFKFIPA